MDKTIAMSPNRVVRFLGKRPADFTRADIIRFIAENGIEMVNFKYPAGDGRLKTLNFVINSLDYLETILASGERVDGSSLFSYIEAGNSDLYVVPRYRTAFVDPFAEIPTLTMLASFYDKDGRAMETAPEHTLAKACDALTAATGLTFQAMGELEYYVISPDEGKFTVADQRGYHESAPFAKYNDFRTHCMRFIAETGGQIKYGHSEVGNFTLNGLNYEQNEIEFLPVDARAAADQLVLAKWVIRNLGAKYGYNITFAPKITTGKAGSGLHIHMRLLDKDGHNRMLSDHRLSPEARRMIAGLMTLAPSLTAFGNTIPTSYFRLVPHQEAPTNVCWGDRNRSALVRVPLGWSSDADMASLANPGEQPSAFEPSMKQTVEIRNADGSADIYALLAGLAVAARHGLAELPDALAVADRTYIDVNIHAAAGARRLTELGQLPTNCHESAERLLADRAVYEAGGVFSPRMIDGIAAQLMAYNDRGLTAEATARGDLMASLVSKYFHCG